MSARKIVLGGREFSVRPVPFGCIKKYADVFEGRRNPTLLEMADIIFFSLKRAEPSLEQEAVEAELDLENLREAFFAVMGASDVEARTPGEAQPGKP